MSTQTKSRPLMNPDEIMRMDNSKCICIIRGLYPFFSDKYDYPRHKNYRFTGDADDKLLFDYRRKFNNELKQNLSNLNLDNQNSRNNKTQTTKVPKVISQGISAENLPDKLGYDSPIDMFNDMQTVGLGEKQIALKSKRKNSKTKINIRPTQNSNANISGQGFDIDEPKPKENPSGIVTAELNFKS